MPSWLWTPPAKHSTRQIDQLLERIALLASLKVDPHLAELPEAIVRRYAGASPAGHRRWRHA